MLFGLNIFATEALILASDPSTHVNKPEANPLAWFHTGLAETRT